ncbi:MAG: hypothetical protein ACPG47_10480, partial [Leucothrix sp.]
MSDAHQRENNEPTEKDRAIPLSIWVVVGILTTWGIGFYIMSADDAIEQPALATTAEAAPQATSAPATSTKAVKTAATTAPTSKTAAPKATQVVATAKPEVA